jgi:hypothetical protein
MKYTLTTKGDTFVRSAPVVGTNIIAKYPLGTILEGDVMVDETATRKWLDIQLINGQQPSIKLYVASWVCTIVENAAPPVYPDFAMELSFSSDTKVTITLPDGIVKEYASGTVKISATNPTMQLV